MSLKRCVWREATRPVRFRLTRLCVGLTLFGACTLAQIVTTDDGAQAYFSVSLRRKDVNEPDQTRIYRFNEGRLELFAAEVAELNVRGDARYALYLPSVSGDGRTVAYTHEDRCGYDNCFWMYSARLAGATLPRNEVVPGMAQISRNGRYLLRMSGFYNNGQLPPIPTQLPPLLIDLATGTSRVLPGQTTFSNGRIVADDGSVLLVVDRQLALWKDDILVRLPIQQNVRFTAMSADAQYFVYVRSTPGQSDEMIAFDRASQTQRLLADGSVLTFQSLTISADGRLVIAALSVPGNPAPQLILFDTRTGTPRQLTNLRERFVSLAVSGNGRVIFGMTDSFRIIRIDVETGRQIELLPVTNPFSELSSGDFAAGSLVRVKSFIPLRDVLVNGKPAPVVNVEDGVSTVQIPWSITRDERTNAVTLSAHTDSPFHFERLAGRVFPVAPERYGPGVLHEASGSPVTLSDPAVPGEAVVVTLTGLGQTSPPMLSEQPTPSEPVRRPIALIGCAFTNSGLRGMDMRTLEAKLIPGLYGVFEVHLQMPDSPPGPAEIRCGGVAWSVHVGAR